MIDVDECTVEMREYSAKNWHKTPNNNLLRAWGGKLGKPKHNLKIHLFGGISRRGLTPLVMFTGIMHEWDYQCFLQRSIIPFIDDKFPYGHRFFMDNDPKHTSHLTRQFLNKIILLMHACKKLHSLRIKLNGNFDWIFLKGLKNLSLKILNLKSFTNSKI